MRIGAKLPNFGGLPAERGLTHMAKTLEEAGFDSIWLSDHIVIPADPQSRYPFSSDGRATSRPTTPWFDAIVSLALAAMATDRVEVGVGVLVVPMREPVTLAKQLASIDAFCGGRVTLGAGTGWLAEEFAAVGAPFDTRGRRMDESLQIIRAVWTGRPQAFAGQHFRLPADLGTLPCPAHPIPILIGGSSPAALRRSRTLGDGWFAFQHAHEISPAPIAEAKELGVRRVVLRVAGDASSVAGRLGELAKAGLDDLVIDVPWDCDDDPARLHDALRSAL